VQCKTFSDCASGYLNCSSNKCICRTPSASNKLGNPGFDGSLGSSWGTGGTYSNSDADLCPGSGSAYFGNYSASIQQCVSWNPSVYAPYNFGFRYKGIVNCWTTYYVMSGCNPSDPDASQGISLVDTSNPVNWLTLEREGAKPPQGTSSIMIGCDGSQGYGYVDQVYLNDAGGYF
jgi:hypothetical protein